jgi:hypothetical protein
MPEAKINLQDETELLRMERLHETCPFGSISRDVIALVDEVRRLRCEIEVLKSA